MTDNQITIRPATLADDGDALWRIIQPVIAAGDSFDFPADTRQPEAMLYCFGAGKHPFVAVDDDGQVLGFYVLKANRQGRGSHIANAGYMVAGEAAGRGVGRLLGQHSINQARKQGFHGIQFNFVVSTNTRAVKLWQSLGWQIIGTIPKGFDHAELGLVDAYVMYLGL